MLRDQDFTIKVRQLLAEDRLEDALNLLMDYIEDDEFILFSAETKRLSKALRIQQINFQEFNSGRTRVIYGILERMADDLEENRNRVWREGGFKIGFIDSIK